MKNVSDTARAIIYRSYRKAIKSIKLKGREPNTAIKRYEKLKRWKRENTR
jgi:hypothetical protein